MPELEIEFVPTKSLVPYARNSKEHPEWQVDQIASSIEEFGFSDPIGIWHDADGLPVIVEGHGRLLAAKKLGIDSVPTICLDHLDDEGRRAYGLVQNKLNMNTGFDYEMLGVELDSITDIDMSQFDFDIDVNDVGKPSDAADDAHASLTERFVVPPFSVLDTRQGYWRDRVQYWRSLIDDDGTSRGTAKTFNVDSMSGTDGIGTISIIDPVLCEVVARWFTPETSRNVFDPFAGDTGFGFVSSYLGCDFTGIELRKEQCDFNNERTSGMSARYICDDGRNVLNHIGVETQDLMFSCPPYFDLEVYSNLKNDASNQETFEDFYEILDDAFSKSIRALKDNRFAVIVIGRVRDKRSGMFYDFYEKVVETFAREGMGLYNDAVLINNFGSAPRRAKGNMRRRKLVTTHQNVLVFFKGNQKNIPSIFPEIEVQYESEYMES